MKNGGQQKCLDKALAVTIMLNNEEIGKHSGKITKIKPFINKYIWEGINFPPEKDDWKKFEKNNLTIVLNVLCAEKEKHILHMFQNKTQNYEKRGDGWHCLAVEKLCALLRGIRSENHVNLYCLNCLHSLKQKTNLNPIKKYVKIKIFVTL